MDDDIKFISEQPASPEIQVIQDSIDLEKYETSKNEVIIEKITSKEELNQPKSKPLNKKFKRKVSHSSSVDPDSGKSTVNEQESPVKISVETKHDLYSSTDSDSDSEESDGITTKLYLRKKPAKVAAKNLEGEISSDSSDSQMSSENDEDSGEETGTHSKSSNKPAKTVKFSNQADLKLTIGTKNVSKNAKAQNSKDPFIENLENLTRLLSLNDETVISNIKAHPLTEIGVVDCIFNGFITVKGFKTNQAVLDIKTALFFEDITLLGLVFDVYGKVNEPNYIVRMNLSDLENIKNKISLEKTKIYFAPHGNASLKKYVQVHRLMNEKYTDASWENDLECPDEFLDYSDDEQEKNAKRKLKQRKRNRDERDGRKFQGNSTAKGGLGSAVSKMSFVPRSVTGNKSGGQNQAGPSRVGSSIQSKSLESSMDAEDEAKLLKQQEEIIDKMAEDQMKILEEIEQYEKENQSIKKCFYSDQNLYKRTNQFGNYYSQGTVYKLHQNQVQNHFATEDNFSKFSTGDDYIRDMQELNPNYADGPSEILEEVYPLPDGVEQADASEPVEEADYKLANDDSKCQADSAKNSTKVDYEDIGHDSQETPIEIEPGLETLKDDNQVEIVQPERHYTCEPNIIGYRKPSH